MNCAEASIIKNEHHLSSSLTFAMFLFRSFSVISSRPLYSCAVHENATNGAEHPAHSLTQANRDSNSRRRICNRRYETTDMNMANALF